ncbi:MAG: LysE family translocator [Acetobacteraceae bacterium]|nr:LysE family translocator [Acetobacteraceae bacterium]
MIDLQLYSAFALATAVLILMPGPIVALVVSNSVAYGTGYGLLTVAGSTSAMLLHMVVIAFGMTAALGALGHWFEVLRWLGVAYLVWLGIRAWRAPAVDLTRVRAQPKSPREIAFRGFLVALANPKTLAFYGAFFPQFITPTLPPGPQLAVLCVTFVVVGVTIDSLWALLAGRVRRLLALHGQWRNRITGGLLVGAGLGLAMVRRS